jgi:hypothetical protein
VRQLFRHDGRPECAVLDRSAPARAVNVPYIGVKTNNLFLNTGMARWAGRALLRLWHAIADIVSDREPQWTLPSPAQTGTQAGVPGSTAAA